MATKKIDAPKKDDVLTVFGSNVFNDKARKEYLSLDAYNALNEAISSHKQLPKEYANEVADGMLKWALGKGATHYTHWFQPLNGLSAEKHDAFIGKPDEKGNITYDFKGNELIKGEPDASSFPSGGLRATFEARGYTVWDASSPAFVLEDDEDGAVLYIPTAFCSYNGEALDGKTPLLRSEEILSEAAVRVLRLLGDDKTQRVFSYAGAEQEYFLIDQEEYLKRKDIVYTGRTLFGASAPKGQELDDHYFGPIREKISSYMKEVNDTLWKLGIAAKTEHNEVAQSQHELACIYETSSLAADQNQLVMRILKRVAKRHGMVCLLAEKPFEGINGSGKHNNWSIGTDTGINLFKPGKDPKNNVQFMIFLASVIRGVDLYADLLRESVASYGNDFRLGANEAPPAIISIYLGDYLNKLVTGEENIEQTFKTINGSKSLPTLFKDDMDRNRTSPFAFTGNRFEFRMVGSEQNISEPNTYLNTIIVDGLNEVATILEKSSNKKEDALTWAKKTIKKHQRVIFNGNGYSKEWEDEAVLRGLPNLKNTPEAISALERKENRDLLIKNNILSEIEIDSRKAIKYQDYHSKAVIEAKTMSRMAHKLYLPAINSSLKEIVKLNSYYENPLETIKEEQSQLETVLVKSYASLKRLDALIKEDNEMNVSEKEHAFFASDKLKEEMKTLRKCIDEAELLVSKKDWPTPTYGDLLFHF